MKSQWIDTATMAAHLGVHPKRSNDSRTRQRCSKKASTIGLLVPRRVRPCSGIWKQRNSPLLTSSVSTLQRWRPTEAGMFKRSISGQSITKHLGGLNGI